MTRYLGLEVITALNAGKLDYLFSKKVIGCYTTSRVGIEDFTHPPLMRVGRDWLGSNFNKSWQEIATFYKTKGNPIALHEDCIWFTLVTGEYQRVNKDKLNIHTYDDQVILNYLDADGSFLGSHTVLFVSDNSLLKVGGINIPVTVEGGAG